MIDMRGARRVGVVVLCGFVTLGTPFVGGIPYSVVGERNTEQIKRDLPNSPNEFGGATTSSDHEIETDQ